MRTSPHAASAAAAAANLFTTKYTDFAAYIVASDSPPHGGASIGETDGQPCTVFCFDETKSVGRQRIRRFSAGECERIEPEVLHSAHRFIRQEESRVRRAAGAR